MQLKTSAVICKRLLEYEIKCVELHPTGRTIFTARELKLALHDLLLTDLKDTDVGKRYAAQQGAEPPKQRTDH